MCPSNAVNWLVRADSCHLDDLRRVALAYVQQHFRRIRTQARGTLAALREHPDLLLEVKSLMLDLLPHTSRLLREVRCLP